jgi:hypothetical protein
MTDQSTFGRAADIPTAKYPWPSPVHMATLFDFVVWQCCLTR